MGDFKNLFNKEEVLILVGVGASPNIVKTFTKFRCPLYRCDCCDTSCGCGGWMSGEQQTAQQRGRNRGIRANILRANYQVTRYTPQITF